MEGLSIYKGDFLPKSEYESWVIPISAYYHSLYQKLVYKTIQLLLDKQAYGQITSICQTAIGIEPFDEEFHYHLSIPYIRTAIPARHLKNIAIP